MYASWNLNSVDDLRPAVDGHGGPLTAAPIPSLCFGPVL